MTTTKHKEGKPEGYVFGRPTIYKNEYPSLLIELMGEQGYSAERFCAHLKIAVDTFYNWLKIHKDFSEAYSIAKTMFIAFWETDLIRLREAEKVQGSLVKFHLVNRLGWTDRSESKVTATVTTHEGSLKDLE